MKKSVLPTPALYPDAEPFWSAVREGRLLLKRCSSCSQAHFYPRSHCPFCASKQTEWIQAEGLGTVYSFSIVRDAPTPTSVAVVALPEGPSLLTVITDADVHALRIGDAVRVTTVPSQSGQPLPAFTTVAAEKARDYSARVLSASRHTPGVPRDGTPVSWRCAAVIGGGTMGVGICTALLGAGIEVCLIDHSQDVLDRARQSVSQNLKSMVERGRISSEKALVLMQKLRVSTRIEDIAGANLIIEAVWEQMALKIEVFAQIDAHADADAVLGTNTSSLDINRIADATRRPGSVVGLHFFSPAHVMPLLELVRGSRTRTDVVAAGLQLGEQLRKTTVVVGVCNGFVGNRLLITREQEASRLLIEGALPHQVDRVLTEFGLPMGSFELADMTAGIELAHRACQERGEKDLIVDRFVELGRLGQKTGKGYYRYEPGKRKPIIDPEVTRIIETLSEMAGLVRKKISDDEIRDRLILPMINEGAKLLEEGIAIRPGDIDVIWQKGYGWPAWKGGPMYYADCVGLAVVRDQLSALRAVHGDRFRPAALLEKLADEGGTFGALNADSARVSDS